MKKKNKKNISHGKEKPFGGGLIPSYLDPRLIEASRKFTPLSDLIPRCALYTVKAGNFLTKILWKLLKFNVDVSPMKRTMETAEMRIHNMDQAVKRLRVSVRQDKKIPKSRKSVLLRKITLIRQERCKRCQAGKDQE